MTTRILLVDDFEQWRFVVRSMLEDTPDFQVIGEASDGAGGHRESRNNSSAVILAKAI